MSQDNRADNQSENNEENVSKTPLELVKEQQAMQQESREVQNQRSDSNSEVPGMGAPPQRRIHPQRKLG